MNSFDPGERLQQLAARWSVDLTRTQTTQSSVLGFGFATSGAVVLKVSLTQHEEWNSGAVLEAFDGRATVRVLAHEPGAVLLEQLKPASPLEQLVRTNRDEEAIEVLADTIARMQEVVPSISGVVSAADWGNAFDWYLAGGYSAVPPDLAHEANETYTRLCATAGSTHLLHGDLHHYNVVWDDHRGWLAIDPKGVVAEVEFELGAALRNPSGAPELYTSRALERRVRQFLGRLDLDADRVVRWTFAQAVLAAIWIVQDGLPLDDSVPALEVARAARNLVA